MLDSVGFTLEVFAALHHVHGLALAPGIGQRIAPGIGQRIAPGIGQRIAPGIGQRIALVPHLADPKSLFGLLGAVHTPVRQAP